MSTPQGPLMKGPQGAFAPGSRLAYRVPTGIRIGATSKFDSNGSGAVAVSNAVNTQPSGSSFIVSIMVATSAVQSAVTDNYGNTYSKIAQVIDTAQGMQVQLWQAMNANGGPGHKWSQAFVDRFIPGAAAVITEIIGGETSGLLDAVNWGTVSNSPVPMPLITKSAKTLILTTMIGNNTGTVKPQNQFGTLAIGDPGSVQAVLALTATVAGTYDPNPIVTLANSFAFITASFKELGSTIQVGTSAVTGPGVQPAQRFQFRPQLGDTSPKAVGQVLAVTVGKNLTPVGPGVQPAQRFQFRPQLGDTSPKIVAAGALAGVSLGQLVSAVGSLSASGALAGVSLLDLITTASLAGAGALAGAANTRTPTTGSLAGAGALAGAAVTTFPAVGSLAGAGAMGGGSIGNSTALGQLLAAALATLGSNLTPVAPGVQPAQRFQFARSMGDTSNIATTIGVLSGVSLGQITAATASLTGAGQLGGTAITSLTLSGTLAGAGALGAIAIMGTQALGAVLGAGALGGVSLSTGIDVGALSSLASGPRKLRVIGSMIVRRLS